MMFKAFVWLTVIISSAFAFMFTCDSQLYKNHAVLYSTYSYNSDTKITQNVYHNPIDMIEYIKHDDNIKYKLCTSLCDAELYYNNIPTYYKLNTDTLIKSDKGIEYYKRNNDDIINYSYSEGFFKTVYYKDGSYQIFSNCKKSTLNPPDLSKCPKPVCSKIADIVFVIDESGSVIEEEFGKIKTFLTDMVNYYDISEDTVNIGIVLFAESDRVVSELSYNKQELLSLINNMGQYKGGTCIACGLNRAMTMLNSRSAYRKSLNPEKIIITLTDGEANKPILNNENKYHADCVSYGNCKSSCTDGSEVKYQKCSSFCPDKNDNYCSSNTCYKYDYNDKTWYYDVRNDKCNINNYVYKSSCCINGADGCCCERVPVVGGCDFGDYNASALTESADNIKKYNINSIAIGVRDASQSQLNGFSDRVYSINSYQSLETLKQNLIEDSCTTIEYTSCGKDCLGFCGCGKKCYCPECEQTGSYCDYYECKNNDFSSTGCVEKSVSCSTDKCHTLTRNPENPKCCETEEIDCEVDDKCKLSYCSPSKGCYYEDVVCNDNDPCTKNECKSDVGCVFTPDEEICKADEVCIKLSSTEHKCSSDCSDGASCGEDNKCGSWTCEDHKCAYNPTCIPDSCHILINCDPSLDNPCIYEEMNCSNPNACYENGRCENGKCVYDEVNCTPDNLCVNSYCDPVEGCIFENITCESDDLCVISECVEHPEWGNSTGEEHPKCEDQVCKTTKCTITGECIYSDVICDNKNDTCFKYVCEDNECVKKPFKKETVDPCGECIEKYHEMGLYLDLNESLCKGEPITNDDLKIVGLAAGAIAGIVVAAVVAGVGISAAGAKGVKTLIDKARQAQNMAAHTNPLFESNDHEMTNPISTEFVEA